MTYLSQSIFFFILLFLRKSHASDISILKDAPCNYNDTVPLTFENGSYFYGQLEVQENYTGTYNYEILVGNETKKTKPHFRGCVCNEYNCISICCPDGGEFGDGQCLKTRYAIDENINIVLDTEETVLVGIANHFVIQYYRPCKDLYYLQPEKNPHLNYSIMENGSLYVIGENRFYDKNSYCLSPKIYSHHEFLFTPLQCYHDNPDDVKMNAIVLLISVPFMLLTIIVYLFIPKLYNIHALSLCCYLGGMSVGYSTLSYLIFKQNNDLSSFMCSFLGYTIYFAFMLAFFWLSVISFDLFTNIHDGLLTKRMKIFRLYSLYAWGLAIICLICTYSAQNLPIPEYLKPGIGTEDSCFISASHGWSAIIYFYGPILLIVLFNTIMFVLTFMTLKRMRPALDDDTNRKKHKALFSIFLRLFIIMGITWMAEILAYVTPRTYWWHKIFKITDFLNAIQGVIIFFVFVVCRKSVRRELKKKFGKLDENKDERSETAESETKVYQCREMKNLIKTPDNNFRTDAEKIDETI